MSFSYKELRNNYVPFDDTTLLSNTRCPRLSDILRLTAQYYLLKLRSRANYYPEMQASVALGGCYLV